MPRHSMLDLVPHQLPFCEVHDQRLGASISTITCRSCRSPTSARPGQTRCRGTAHILGRSHTRSSEWSCFWPLNEPGIPRIGICWSTGVNAYNPHNYDVHKKKSVPFDLLKPVLDVPGVAYVSLQTGDEAEGMPNPGIKTFSDTAAILHHLDGVITVDTALANLAGAMGAKTYLIDRFDYDWRYHDKLKQPWYPTVTPYRQTVLNDWSPVISSLVDEMKKLAANKMAA